MRHQGRVGLARTLHGPLLYHCNPVCNLRRGNDFPIPLGRTVPALELVRGLGGGGVPGHSRRGLYLGIQERRLRVGLKSPIYSLGFLLFSSFALHAAPVLRLSSATIGPIVLASAGAT